MRSPKTHRRSRSSAAAQSCAVAAAAWVASALPLAATSAGDLCAPAADPCTVSTAVVATPDSIIDVGDRELRIAATGSLTMRSGRLTLRGRRIVTVAGSLVRTSGPTRAHPAADLEIDADEVVLAGEIDARGSPAGAVDITAAVSLQFSGSVRGRAEAADASAATVTVSAPTVEVGGSIDLAGGRDDFGGDVVIAGDRVTLTGTIAVDGGDGGTVDVAATESILVATTASISANATTAAGDGGDVALDSDELLDFRGTIAASGRAGGDDGGGDGGQVVLVGDGGLLIPSAAASIRSLGGSPDGLAGDIDVSSLFGGIVVNGTLAATSAEREGTGGTIDVSASTDALIGGTLRTTGATGGGGGIEIDGGASITVAQGAILEANATREGNAGGVDLLAETLIDVAGTILAEANSSTALGGTIRADACNVTTRATAVLRSRGRDALNALTAAGPLTIRGSVSAVGTQAANVLRYPLAGPTPDTSGAVIAPPPRLEPDAAIVPCNPPPATPTPPPPSPSPTPTFTTAGAACAGDCDGNGVVSIAELIRAVNIALGESGAANCRAADENGDERVTIAELIRAVGSALRGCGIALSIPAAAACHGAARDTDGKAYGDVHLG